jgi:hypothetical protein
MASLSALCVAAAMLATTPQANPPKLSRKAARGFVAGGVAGTAVMTWTAGLVAAKHLDSSSPATRAHARLTLVPVVGPILSAQRHRDTGRALVAVGTYQAISLGLLGVGAVSLARHNRRDPKRRRADKTMGALVLTQGVMWLIASYGVTAAFTRSRVDASDPYARNMMVPVVGGILAAPHASTHVRGYWGLTSAAFQLAAVGSVVWGSAVLARHRRDRKVSVAPMPTPTGAHLVATMRF